MSTLEEHLTQLIESAVLAAIEKATPAKQDIETFPPYVTAERIMEMTGWSRRTIQHLRDTRQIDFVQHGHKILYPTTAFFEFLESCRITRRE